MNLILVDTSARVRDAHQPDPKQWKKQIMLRHLFGSKKPTWKESKAHLLLLSKFMSPRDLQTDFKYVDDWEDVLGESFDRTIEQFKEDKVIRPASETEVLSKLFTVKQLKVLLRERDLKASGRKADLIARLVESDPQTAQEEAAKTDVWICSEEGRQVTQTFLEKSRREKEQAYQQVIEALNKKQYEQASIVVAQYESEQVFSRGIEVDWENHDPSHDIAILRLVFSRTPKLLKDVSESNIKHLRLQAGVSYLWGRDYQVLPEGFEIGINMDPYAAARMLWFHAKHVIDLQQYADLDGVEQFRINTANDDSVCDACVQMAERTYTLQSLPELPHEKCTCEMGCRCFASPVITI